MISISLCNLFSNLDSWNLKAVKMGFLYLILQGCFISILANELLLTRLYEWWMLLWWYLMLVYLTVLFVDIKPVYTNKNYLWVCSQEYCVLSAVINDFDFRDEMDCQGMSCVLIMCTAMATTAKYSNNIYNLLFSFL